MSDCARAVAQHACRGPMLGCNDCEYVVCPAPIPQRLRLHHFRHERAFRRQGRRGDTDMACRVDDRAATGTARVFGVLFCDQSTQVHGVALHLV